MLREPLRSTVLVQLIEAGMNLAKVPRYVACLRQATSVGMTNLTAVEKQWRELLARINVEVRE